MNATRSSPVRSLACRITGFGLLMLFVAGCGSTGSLSGKVTYQGKPLVYGTVLVIGGNNASVQAEIQKDGRYYAPGLVAGDVKIAVNSPNPKGVAAYGGWKGEGKKPTFEVPGWFAIPRKYEDVSTSGLTFPLKPGSNTFDIELK